MAKSRTWNRPLDRVHCPANSYGFLLFPLGQGRWLMWTDNGRFRRTWWKGFHNCSASGVY